MNKHGKRVKPKQGGSNALRFVLSGVAGAATI
jgi:hypothetical protein